MAIDSTTFLIAYPEFKDAPPALVSQHLAYSITLTPLVPWGALQEQGAFLYTAQALSLSPFARKMALVSKTGETIYDKRLLMLKRIVTSGYRMTT